MRTTGIVALIVGILGVAVGVFVLANSSSSPEPNRGVRALQLATEAPEALDTKPGGLWMEFTYAAGAQFWSPAARAALDTAAVRFTANFVVDPPVILNAIVTGFNEPANTTLASASSDLGSPGGRS